MPKPRAYTKQEVQEMFLDQLKSTALFWADSSLKYDNLERLMGFLHSILSIIDGGSADFCAMNLVLSPQPEDKKYCISEGENYFKRGMVINDDVCFHEILYKEKT